MKKIIVLFLTLMIVCGLHAANNRNLDWYKPTASVPDFEGSYHPENQILPVYLESFEPAVSAKSYQVRILYPVYSKLTSLELKAIESVLKTIPDSLSIAVNVGMARKKTILDLSLSPFVRTKGVYYKLVSFNLDIAPTNVAELRSTQAITYAANSVLATGKWKKISVSESGMYKLTYSDIKNMGIDPAKVQIYGYGGKLLAENFALNDYSDDLPEVAMYKDLGSDGVFNSGDYILFYAQGPISWSFNSSYSMYLRTRNHYSDKAYYFVGEREAGSLIASVLSFTGTPNKVITSFTDFQLHEEEKVNIGQSVAGHGTGRQLYGEDLISSPSQIIGFNVPNPDSTAYSKLFVDATVNNQQSTYANVFVNNAYLSTMNFLTISLTNEYQYSYDASTVGSFKQKTNKLSVQLDYHYSATTSLSRAYLNTITLNARRFLKMDGSAMAFRDPVSVGSGNIGRFVLQNATSKLLVFDVTDQKNMVQMNGSLNNGTYEFIHSNGTLHEYIAVETDGAIPKPVIEGSVANQDLHGKTGVDMVIVTPPEFEPYAQKLAEAHRVHDGLNVLIVTPEQVYNEFSSGTPDATAIRRMMKLYYDRGQVDSQMPDYLLLFGDGVYDNRLVSTSFVNSSSKPNKIVTYESIESNNGSSSYVTDDYFGFLDDSEGSSLSSAKLDIGIGRFPVSSTKEAQVVVDKAISYMYNSRVGSWKNRLLFLADDELKYSPYLHVTQADAMATTLGNAHPEFMINKIYIDTYKKVVSASGASVPDANTKFAELLDEGLLLLNYTGHGSTTQWAEEKLLDLSIISKMTNKCQPLWVTATCDFTRYDGSEVSGGEKIFLKENGGGIALFTTSRVVYSDDNYKLNKCFLANIFAKNNGVRYTLGQIMSLAKRDNSMNGNSNKLNFTLIGDPALKLGYPEFSAQVTAVNGKAVSTVPDTLRALSQVTISGKVYREDGTFADNFNGLITPSILDASEIIAKLDNLTIYDQSKVLFSGKDSVVNGQFSFTFVVPKDNSYSLKKGCINLYASDATGVNEAQGYFDRFLLGGTNQQAIINHDGPAVALYLNNEHFVDGGTVQETPTLIAMISDENGLNTSGNGIGHNIKLMVDDDPSKTYNLNTFFSANVGSYQAGTVRFQIPELSAGDHFLTFRAWDVQNNSTSDTLHFKVKPGLAPEVTNVQFVQNGSNSGQFIFTHNRPKADVSVKISIFDLLGREIWQSKMTMQTESNASDLLNWDLTDTNDRRIADGIYICRIMVTDLNGAESFGSKKILISRQ